MGGDWNCTYSTFHPATNIDIFKMANAPNLNHSKLLKKLCDPFRTKFPNRLEFTYLPSNTLRQNHSRIDFFIISCSLYNSVTEIVNKSSLQNKLFDHMAVRLSFIPKPKNQTPPTISKLILEDPDLGRIVALAVADTYLIHSSLLAENVRVGLQHQLGIAKGTLRACGPDSAHLYQVTGASWKRTLEQPTSPQWTRPLTASLLLPYSKRISVTVQHLTSSWKP